MSESLRKLIARWRAEKAQIDSFHATMGTGYGVCADELEAALAALHAAPSKDMRKAFQQLFDAITTSHQPFHWDKTIRAAIDAAQAELDRVPESADPLASGGWQAEEKHVSMLVDGVMALLDGAYRRGLFAPDYRHLVRADVDRFVRTAFASFQIPIPPLPAEPETQQTPQKPD